MGSAWGVVFMVGLGRVKESGEMALSLCAVLGTGVWGKQMQGGRFSAGVSVDTFQNYISGLSFVSMGLHPSLQSSPHFIWSQPGPTSYPFPQAFSHL